MILNAAIMNDEIMCVGILSYTRKTLFLAILCAVSPDCDLRCSHTPEI